VAIHQALDRSYRTTHDEKMSGTGLGILGLGRAGTAVARLALPLGRYRTIATDRLTGKIVIGAMNWAFGESILAEFEGSPQHSSEKIQAFLSRSRVLKTLNHIGYHELEEAALPEGTPGRLAFGLAGDDPDAKMIVAGLINNLGFDSLDVGLLSEGWRKAPGSFVFGGRFTLEELRRALHQVSPAS
jgi:hypothetical protein